MNIVLNKTTMAALITVILVAVISTQLILLPSANAHSPSWSVVSYAYVSVAPSPVGIGQTVQVYMWVDTPMPSAATTNDIRRHGYQLTITKPNGETESHSWDRIDDTTGMQFWAYTPDQLGTYTLKFNYAGQTYTWGTNGANSFTTDYFQPANATTTLVVDNNQLPQPLDSFPLPTEYWTRPIEGQNVYWYAISSNWLNAPYIRSGATVTGGAGYGRYQPDGTAPGSSHVMWSKALAFGGVVGGSDTFVPGETFYMGGSYNVRFTGAIVMQGNLYYQEPYGNGGGGGAYVAVNIRTGEELWRINASATGTSIVPTFGYQYSFETGNQHGVLPNGLLIAPTNVQGLGTVWRAYDPRTGVLTTMNVTNVPSGTAQAATLAPSAASAVSVPGAGGELLIYTLANGGTTTSPQMYLSQWNSSKVIGAEGGNGVANWYSGTVNASTKSAYDWNVSVPALKGTAAWNIYRDAYYDDILLAFQGSFGAGPRATSDGVTVVAISIKAGSYGNVIFSKYYAPAAGNMTEQIIAVDNIARVFITEDKENLQLKGYSLTDGSLVWTADRLVKEWDTVREDTLTAYGKLYTAGFDGILYCFDDKTGKLEWTYGNGGAGNSTYEGLGTAYGHMPIFVDVIADGKVILGSTEHSPGSPWYKNAMYRAINATNGAELWTITGWGTGMYVGQYDIVADGYFMYLNCYDMKVYSVGKGPSDITVSASPKVSTAGSSIILE